MTVKTEAARGTLTYSRMRGMVAILIGECRNFTELLGYAKWKFFSGRASDECVWRRTLRSHLDVYLFLLS